MVPGSVEMITPKSESELPIPGGTETILVIEDEELLLDLVVSLFEQYGYTVLTSPDGEEAISIYEKNHSAIHLVVTDLGLPKMNGWQAFQKMKEINPNVKAILATGYLEPHEKNQFLEGGISEIVPKPYEPSELLRKIYKTLHPIS
jgi:CheY-like chemotaxis protein